MILFSRLGSNILLAVWQIFVLSWIVFLIIASINIVKSKFEEN